MPATHHNTPPDTVRTGWQPVQTGGMSVIRVEDNTCTTVNTPPLWCSEPAVQPAAIPPSGNKQPASQPTNQANKQRGLRQRIRSVCLGSSGRCAAKELLQRLPQKKFFCQSAMPIGQQGNHQLLNSNTTKPLSLPAIGRTERFILSTNKTIHNPTQPESQHWHS